MDRFDRNHPCEGPVAGLTKKKRTGIVVDPRYAGHCMGPGEPECPERLDVLVDLLEEPGLKGAFEMIDPVMVNREDLSCVHSAAYIRRLEETAGKPATYLDEDTRTSPLSNEVARLAAGGLCRAIQQVHAGCIDNAFALIRPPGHHAERTRAKGFCLYNNVAIAARYAQNKLGLKRILIVDWDLHHGNGTQHCFEDDPSVLFVSIHQAFTYPHSGRLREVGKGPGRGYTVNIPLLAGCGDGEYLDLFTRLVKPIALAFHPDLVLVSAGFDIHADDPLGKMKVTPSGFAGMTRILMEIADICCQGKLVMTLEGGYHLEALRNSVHGVLDEMTGRQTTDVKRMAASADKRKVAYVIWRVSRALHRYWPAIGRTATDGDLPIVDRLKGDLARWISYFKN